jgi:Amt family ammonium transporter
VVHLTAGVSALVMAVMLGGRRGFPHDIVPPHNPGMVMMGASMLWVGWFGFNGGSALAANGAAGMAIAVTHISAAMASLTWMIIEWKQYGKPSLVGFVTGTIAGLATITPASGFVGPAGALIIGVAAGVICYVMVHIIKQRFKIDDSLDVFAVHGIGGLTGTLLVSFLALPSFGGLGLADGMTAGGQLEVQAIGAVAVASWSAVGSVIIIWVVRAVTSLRVSEDDETEGLDLTVHGERGYNF